MKKIMLMLILFTINLLFAFEVVNVKTKNINWVVEKHRDYNATVYAHFKVPKDAYKVGIKKRLFKHNYLYRCFTNSGYDRAHLATDMYFDSNYKTLKKVYQWANIVPELPRLNRVEILTLERKILELSKEHDVEVTIQVIYSNRHLKDDGRCPLIPDVLVYTVYVDGDIYLKRGFSND